MSFEPVYVGILAVLRNISHKSFRANIKTWTLVLCTFWVLIIDRRMFHELIHLISCEAFSDSSNPLVRNSFIHAFIHSFIYSFILSFIHSFYHSFYHLFTYSFILLFTNLPIHPFIYSFIHSFMFIRNRIKTTQICQELVSKEF